MTFGEKLKMYRLKKSMTQAQAADAAGISRRTYVYYETGKKLPRKRETIDKLAELLGVESDFLFITDDEIINKQEEKLPMDYQAEKLIQYAQRIFSDQTLDIEIKESLYKIITEIYQSNNMPEEQVNNSK